MTQIEKLQARGIHRLGTKAKGFRYRTADGRSASAADLLRIRRLALPPAWSKVFIAASDTAALQAVGQDQKGRWQYRYHPAWVQRRDRIKYDRLLAFAEALPRLRSAVQRDLRADALVRRRVLACMVRIMATCFIRGGSRVYAEENGSYGLATLQRRHVSVRGDRIKLAFPGKSGLRHEHELKDAQVARVVRALLRLPGRHVFKFQVDDGAWIKARRRHANDYLKEVMGPRFTVKDFRTWAGTLVCACAVAREGERARLAGEALDPKRQVKAAIKEAARALGNTPAVCKSSYISPRVIEGCLSGETLSHHLESVEQLAGRSSDLVKAERELLHMLRKGQRRRKAPSNMAAPRMQRIASRGAIIAA